MLVNIPLYRKYNYTPELHQQMSKAASLLKELEEVCADLIEDSDSEDEEGIPNLFEDD